MGNSNSQDAPNSQDDNDENDPQEDRSIVQTIGNNIVIIESVIYIIGHLWRIYQRTSDPDKDLTNDLLRPREHIFSSSDSLFYESDFNSQQTGIYNAPSAPNIDQLDPIGPESTNDEEVPEDDNDTKVCIRCATNKIKTIVLACGHMALCLGCSREYTQRELAKVNPKLECIICKRPVTQIKEIFEV